MMSLTNFLLISLLSLGLMSACSPSPKSKRDRVNKPNSASTLPNNLGKMSSIAGKDDKGLECKTSEQPFTQSGNKRNIEECRILADHALNKNCATNERKKQFETKKCTMLGIQWAEPAPAETRGSTENRRGTPTTNTSGTSSDGGGATASKEGDDSAAVVSTNGSSNGGASTSTVGGGTATQNGSSTTTLGSGATTTQTTATTNTTTNTATTAQQSAVTAAPFQQHLNIRSTQLEVSTADYSRAKAVSDPNAAGELDASLGLISIDEANSPQIQQNLSDDMKAITKNMITRIEECEPDLEGAACDADDMKNPQNLFHRFIERADQENKVTFYHLAQRQSKTNKQGEPENHKQIVFLYEIKGEADGASSKLKKDKIESIKLRLFILKSTSLKINSMQELKSLLEERTVANQKLHITAELNMKQINYSVLLNRLTAAEKVNLFLYKFDHARKEKLLEIFNHFTSDATSKPYNSKEEMRTDLKRVLQVALDAHTTRSHMLKDAEDNTSPTTRYNALFVRNLTTLLAEFALSNASANTDEDQKLKKSIVQFLLSGLENSSDKIKQYSVISLRLMDRQGDNAELKAHAKYNEILAQLSASTPAIADNNAELRAHFESKRSALNLQSSPASGTATVTTGSTDKTTLPQSSRTQDVARPPVQNERQTGSPDLQAH